MSLYVKSTNYLWILLAVVVSVIVVVKLIPEDSRILGINEQQGSLNLITTAGDLQLKVADKVLTTDINTQTYSTNTLVPTGSYAAILTSLESNTTIPLNFSINSRTETTIVYDIGPHPAFTSGYILYAQDSKQTTSSIELSSIDEQVEVSIDKENYGTTPLRLPIKTVAESKSIQFSKPGYDSIELALDSEVFNQESVDIFIMVDLMLQPMEVSK